MKPHVTEREIDAVLSRTLSANHGAVRACLTAAAPRCGSVAFDRVTVERQVVHRDTHGTADLVLRLWLREENIAMILIENKIDAGFTPDQPERYAISRDAHRLGRSAGLVATLLVSPAIYIAGSRLKAAFDGTLSYEDLLPFMDVQDRVRIKLAIERASSPYEPVPVQRVMSFFEGYAAIAAAWFPDLCMKSNPNSANARPAASRTIYFDTHASGFRRYPILMKGDKPASVRVSHQCWDSSAPNASVKLMLDGWAGHIATVAPLLQPALRGTGIYIRSAGRSLALVADTGRLDNMRVATAQQAAIEDGLHKLQRIRDVWNSIEATITAAGEAVLSS